MREDVIKVQILEDGRIRVETDPISAANHGTAEQLLKMIAADAGGPTTRERKPHKHHHGHTHAAQHENA